MGVGWKKWGKIGIKERKQRERECDQIREKNYQRVRGVDSKISQN